jgi:septum site-determining protein MinC
MPNQLRQTCANLTLISFARNHSITKGESSIMNSSGQPARQVVRLLGRSYVAFVFSPIKPIVGWLKEIDAMVERSPGFFVGKPVVLDLSAADLSPSEIVHLVKSLEQRNIRVLGFEGVDAAHLDLSMPPLLTGGRDRAPQLTVVEKRETTPQATSLVIESPVRSGQSVTFIEGDVTVLGSVGSGAEIVAGGSIHVYGTLRGRAMAGVKGNSSARIYCQRIEAELLAIDGYYQIAEELDANLRSKPVQARLEGKIIRITPLN